MTLDNIKGERAIIIHTELDDYPTANSDQPAYLKMRREEILCSSGRTFRSVEFVAVVVVVAV